MKILVINCGSSSLKYQILDMTNETLLCKGLVEKIGIDGSVITHEKVGMDKFRLETPMANHEDAIAQVLAAIQDPEHGVVKDMSEIGAVGHRVVHGGEKYADSVLITEAVMKDIEECCDIAPLHNPPNIAGINACKALMPDTPMVAVFDTAFHQTMPPESYLYAIPYEYYTKYHIRRYGFHGTSHKYVSRRAAEMLNVDLDDLKIITCHLGNGSSITAVQDGKCLDTSMGFTPLAGPIMGTRCGNIDPNIVPYVMKKEGLTPDQMTDLMNKKSGFLGLSGFSSDVRDLNTRAEEGDARAKLVFKVFTHEIIKIVGSYIAEMSGVDLIVFTAGIGENNARLRRRVCENFAFLGLAFDYETNAAAHSDAIISLPESKIKVAVVNTNEELVIARDTMHLVQDAEE